MSTTFNGWPALYSPPKTYFTAPNGKRVYCANADVATIFEYVARQWHNRIEPLPKATCNVGDPCVRTGYIVIHAYRAPNTTIGTGNRSNHRSATGMDILGDKHPYEATNPPHLRGPGYNDGFTNAQRAELRKIQQEIGRARGRLVLRLGIDFAVGLRDGMHVEIAPGVTAADVKATAARLRTDQGVEDLTEIHRLLLDLGYTADTPGVRAFQKDHGLTIDGIPGPKTTAALEAVMSAVLNELKAIRAELQDHRARLSKLHERQTNLGQSNNNVNRNLTDLIAKVPAAVWAYRNPGYPQRDAHGLARDGATAKQGLRELAAALRSTGAINATGEATVQAATDSDTQED